MGDTLIGDIFDGLGIGVRACAASLAVLLLFRSLSDRIRRRNGVKETLPLLKSVDAFVVPVRTALPLRLRHGAIDYAPLVSALIILVFGLGVSALLEKLYSMLFAV